MAAAKQALWYEVSAVHWSSRYESPMPCTIGVGDGCLVHSSSQHVKALIELKFGAMYVACFVFRVTSDAAMFPALLVSPSGTSCCWHLHHFCALTAQCLVMYIDRLSCRYTGHSGGLFCNPSRTHDTNRLQKGTLCYIRNDAAFAHTLLNVAKSCMLHHLGNCCGNVKGS